MRINKTIALLLIIAALIISCKDNDCIEKETVGAVRIEYINYSSLAPGINIYSAYPSEKNIIIANSSITNKVAFSVLNIGDYFIYPLPLNNNYYIGFQIRSGLLTDIKIYENGSFEIEYKEHEYNFHSSF